jgi:hypothetical protein
LSLLELLISLSLGAILSAAMVTVYLESRRSELAHNEFVTMQENGVFALNLLRQELALAGFLAATAGSAALTAAVIARDCGIDTWALDTAQPIDLIEDYSGVLNTVAGVHWRCLNRAEVQPGTDLFSVKRSAGDPSLNDGTFPPRISSAEETQWYLRLAGQGSEQRWQYIGRGENFPAADRVAGSGVEFWEFYARLFYIRTHSSRPGDGIPTLCVEQLSGNGMATDCLVEGVEDMQIELGIDRDGDGVPEQFGAPVTPGQLERAVTARVYLLLRSINPLSGYRDNRSYQLGMKRTPPRRDGFFRRVVTTTVSLRNLGRGNSN